MKRIFKLLLQLLASAAVGFGTLSLGAIGMYVLIDVAVKNNIMPMFTIILAGLGIYASFFGLRWIVGFLRTWRVEKSGTEQLADGTIPKKTRLLLAPLWIGFSATVGAFILVSMISFSGAPGGFTLFSGFWPAIFLTGYSVALTFLGSTKTIAAFRKRILFLTIVSLLWWVGLIFSAWCQDTGTQCVPFYNPS